MFDSPEIRISDALPQLEASDLIRAYSGLLCLADNTEERNRVMSEFEESCPGALKFLFAVDNEERIASQKNGEEVPKEEEFMPYAYGMLMCLLTLQHASRLKKLRSSIDDIFS